MPFIELTNYDVPRLYELKGEIVSRGIAAVTGMKMPVFPKRRFQHGAMPEADLRIRMPFREAEYRKHFLSAVFVTGRATLDPARPWQFLAEEEPGSDGEIAAVNTLFLTNRECPWSA